MKARKAKKTTRKITMATYREKRAYLADHCFFTVPGGGKNPKAKNILGKKEWSSLMTLPTDVLLRTTDYLGPMVDDMLTQSYAWLRSLPDDSTSMPFMFEVALDTHDELNAAPFIATHGWYRQATAALRNALEAMTHAARYAVKNDTAGYTSWRAGGQDPKFGNSIDIIGASGKVAPIETMLGGSALFGNKPNGVMRTLYADVCRYAHSAPGFTNAEIWSSNGPVFVGQGFTQFWLDYSDTLMACYVLLKLGYPALTLPKAMKSVPANAGPSWNGLAAEAMAAYFP
jgi:hypothetical protein